MINQEDFLKRVGKNIQDIRIARGLHTGIIADKMGVPLTSIEGIEAGLVNPSLVDIYDIASCLEVDPKELFR
jgi:transcriptional regulator with XRE-family HTH domain